MKLMKDWKNISRKKTETASDKTLGPGNGQPRHQTVTIEALIDVGYGNTLYLRGHGRGLNWDHGVPLKCVDSTTWVWSGPVDDQVRFKLLLNDSVWAQGDDLVAAPGQKIQVAPAF